MNDRAYIDEELCEQCPECPAQEHCGKDAIKRDEEQDRLFINQMCNGCGKCLKHCVHDAINLV